jgi:hypothetical protein
MDVRERPPGELVRPWAPFPLLFKRLPEGWHEDFCYSCLLVLRVLEISLETKFWSFRHLNVENGIRVTTCKNVLIKSAVTTHPSHSKLSLPS